MNRRRIALGALIIGVGATVARRLRTQADPGPAPHVQSGATTERPSATPDVGYLPNEPAAAGIESDSPAAGIVPGQGDNALGSPAIDLPVTEPASDSIEAAPVTDGVLGDPEIELPHGDSHSAPERAAEQALEPETTPEPDPATSSEPGPDSAPRIVLPTMPRAGTNKVGLQTKSVSAPHEPPPVDPTQAELPTAPAGAAAQPPESIPESTTSMFSPARTPAHGAVPFSAPPSAHWRRRWGGWSIFGGVIGTILIVSFIAATLVRLPYYTLEPGSVYDTVGLIRAPGDLVSIPTGEIGFVTVSQTARISPWQWLDAKLDSNVRIRSEEDVQGDQTADELREADVRRMQVSKDAAVVVALRKLGYDLVVTPIGIEVAQVFPCTAAEGKLGTGDLIVGVDGVDVRDGEQLVAALVSIGVGEDVELLVERIDPSNPTQSMHTDLVNLTLGSADDACLSDEIRADEPRAFIGIGTLTIFDEDFPIDIEILTGDVSGPSAGLAFTLAVIDVLSEGELTNGLNIVATGTIDRDGNVGPVGGIQQKTVAAERSGADVFIVPACCDNFVDRNTGEPLDLPTNYEEAVMYADEMIVIGVATLDEALQAIGELGGDVDQFLS